MSLGERGMCSGEVCVVVRELAVLVASWDARSRKKRLRPGAKLAIAARHAAVVGADGSRTGGYRLPASAFTKWANFYRGLDHLGPSSISNPRRVTLAGVTCFARGGRGVRPYMSLFRLCTRGWVPRKPESVAGCVHPVQDRGVLWTREENAQRGSAKPLRWPRLG